MNDPKENPEIERVGASIGMGEKVKAEAAEEIDDTTIGAIKGAAEQAPADEQAVPHGNRRIADIDIPFVHEGIHTGMRIAMAYVNHAAAQRDKQGFSSLDTGFFINHHTPFPGFEVVVQVQIRERFDGSYSYSGEAGAEAEQAAPE